MSIPLIRTLPDHNSFSQFKMTQVSPAQIAKSTFSGNTTRVSLRETYHWKVSAKIATKKRDQAEEWVAFLISLRGRLRSFEMGDPLGQHSQGTAEDYMGNFLNKVRGGNQVGEAINFHYLPPGKNGLFKAGDYITLGTGSNKVLYLLTEGMDTNSQGRGTFHIWPPLLTPLGDGAQLANIGAWVNPVGIFYLTSDTVDYTMVAPDFYSISFDAISTNQPINP